MMGSRSLWRSRDASTSPPRRTLNATKVAAPEPGAGIQDLSPLRSDCCAAGDPLASLGTCDCACVVFAWLGRLLDFDEAGRFCRRLLQHLKWQGPQTRPDYV